MNGDQNGYPQDAINQHSMTIEVSPPIESSSEKRSNNLIKENSTAVDVTSMAATELRERRRSASVSGSRPTSNHGNNVTGIRRSESRTWSGSTGSFGSMVSDSGLNLASMITVTEMDDVNQTSMELLENSCDGHSKSDVRSKRAIRDTDVQSNEVQNADVYGVCKSHRQEQDTCLNRLANFRDDSANVKIGLGVDESSEFENRFGLLSESENSVGLLDESEIRFGIMDEPKSFANIRLSDNIGDNVTLERDNDFSDDIKLRMLVDKDCDTEADTRVPMLEEDMDVTNEIRVLIDKEMQVIDLDNLDGAFKPEMTARVVDDTDEDEGEEDSSTELDGLLSSCECGDNTLENIPHSYRDDTTAVCTCYTSRSFGVTSGCKGNAEGGTGSRVEQTERTGSRTETCDKCREISHLRQGDDRIHNEHHVNRTDYVINNKELNLSTKHLRTGRGTSKRDSSIELQTTKSHRHSGGGSVSSITSARPTWITNIITKKMAKFICQCALVLVVCACGGLIFVNSAKHDHNPLTDNSSHQKHNQNHNKNNIDNNNRHPSYSGLKAGDIPRHGRQGDKDHILPSKSITKHGYHPTDPTENVAMDRPFRGVSMAEFEKHLASSRTPEEMLKIFFDTPNMTDEEVNNIMYMKKHGTISAVTGNANDMQGDQPSNTAEQLRKAAFDHHMAMEKSPYSECREPKPELQRVTISHQDTVQYYLPDCTIVHRCRSTTACCPRGWSCAPNGIEIITKYFMVLEKVRDGSDALVPSATDFIKSQEFINHTSCACKQNPGARQTCHKDCPTHYRKHQRGPNCHCRCISGHRRCHKIQKGLFPLEEQDLQGMKEGKILKPHCQFGEFNVNNGFCPRPKKKKHKARL